MVLDPIKYKILIYIYIYIYIYIVYVICQFSGNMCFFVLENFSMFLLIFDILINAIFLLFKNNFEIKLKSCLKKNKIKFN